MDFLKRLLDGTDKPAAAPGQPPPAPAPPEPPATIRVFDSYGRALQIPREEWRTKILPGRFQECWSQPDELAATITQALNDGFAADALAPARQLQRIDPQGKRSATILAVILMELKQLGEAESVLTAALKQYGEDPILLVNLAKIQAAKGEQALAERTVRHVLDLDPNLRDPLLWYAAMQEQRGDVPARRQALLEIAALPGSWRAYLWLARLSLEGKDVAAALALYRQALAIVRTPPTDLILQASGDLGMHGHLRELVDLCAPHFDTAVHGLVVGNNLIRAYLTLGEVAKAHALVEQLHAMQRPDWRETLTLWEGEIGKAQRAGPPPEPGSLELAVIPFTQPIWALDGFGFDAFLPAKAADAARVCFVAGSVTVAAPAGGEVTVGESDSLGRFSRALPLFLMEQVHLRTALQPVFLLP
jgi:tetratricopeptide (TPR) repeat protein